MGSDTSNSNESKSKMKHPSDMPTPRFEHVCGSDLWSNLLPLDYRGAPWLCIWHYGSGVEQISELECEKSRLEYDRNFVQSYQHIACLSHVYWSTQTYMSIWWNKRVIRYAVYIIGSKKQYTFP